ncbi:MAG: glycosyltransferase family 4 protein, partial [Acidobacteriota bacterium]
MSAALHAVQITRRFTDRAWGGTETVVLETSRRLPERGASAEIFTTTALDPRRRGEMGGVPIHRFPYFYPWLGLGADQRRQLDEIGGNLFSTALGGALARRRFDLLHLHTGKRLGGIGRTVARLRGVPYVVTLHGGVVDVPRSEVERWTPSRRRGRTLEWGKALGLLVGSRRVLDDAAAVLTVNLDERVKLQSRLPNQRVEWMPNGVDTRTFSRGDGLAFKRRFRIPDDRRVLLVVGRIDPQKNQRLALEIVSEMRRVAGPRWHLALVGPTTDADYGRDLERRIDADPELRGAVTWVPGLAPGSRELVDAYHAAEFVLVPSVHEPFGIVALEAWAARRPVLAHRVGGLAGLVEARARARCGAASSSRSSRTHQPASRESIKSPSTPSSTSSRCCSPSAGCSSRGSTTARSSSSA